MRKYRTENQSLEDIEIHVNRLANTQRGSITSLKYFVKQSYISGDQLDPDDH